MIAGNVNDNDMGRQVRTIRELRVNPWWEDEAVTLPAGSIGWVARVESHGNNPFTRYTVTFGGRRRTSGAAIGHDVEWA